MARSRNIKPSIMDNEELAELPALTRLLFIFMWMLADRAGRLEDRPSRIKKQALGYDDGNADQMLNELAQAGFIERYESQGIKVIQILNFSKHQTPHVRESDSELPCKAASTTKEVPSTNLGSAETSPRSPDTGFLIPDTPLLIPDAPKAAPVDELFEKFWNEYPKKKSKDDARKAFEKRKPTESLLSDILKAIAWQKRSESWTKDGGKFIPYPATWLNDGAWQDAEAIDLEQKRIDAAAATQKMMNERDKGVTAMPAHIRDQINKALRKEAA